MSNWFGNVMTFNEKGMFDLSDCTDRDLHDYKEQLYLECWWCNDFVHAAKGNYDNDKFHCAECYETRYQPKNK